MMEVFGIDMTSRPTRAKPLAILRARLDGGELRYLGHERCAGWAGLDAALRRPGPWIAGLDFPFSFARAFVERMGWPMGWAGLAHSLSDHSRETFGAAVRADRDSQPAGHKHLPRDLDRRTGGAAPNNIVNPPVGLMLFEGAARLAAAGCALPGLADGDPDRRAVEAYPALVARALIGPTPYKDGRLEDRDMRFARRQRILDGLAMGALPYGLRVHAPTDLAEDRAGDDLDALLCAVQAAWAWRAGHAHAGPPGADPVEGWIADPAALARTAR